MIGVLFGGPAHGREIPLREVLDIYQVVFLPNLVPVLASPDALVARRGSVISYRLMDALPNGRLMYLQEAS